jgi:hypothetical protein
MAVFQSRDEWTLAARDAELFDYRWQEIHHKFDCHLVPGAVLNLTFDNYSQPPKLATMSA